MPEQRGKYYVLPCEGAQIQQIRFGGIIRLDFDFSGRNHLTLIGKFQIRNYTETFELQPDSKEALLFFYNLYATGILIEEAKADKDGRLFLTFSNKIELVMEEASECWEFSGPSKQKPYHVASISGGLGYLDSWVI
ncbi:DUF6188 family protein [Hymenobacter sp. ASUV-10]|uniref:DUF6188 family protein n=1 Tax=Hymenobacter aranciens TaxID=3063996 RepID=A0ABT9BE58_9BACT|nr:DUF6188 family protein [Hymenobacter sp. ASUV-10]MDO7876561.1 DUF6188 family protein [Hymenobacter sp. ASUV-10]